ncbi:hypothetical protein AVEN_57772-1 [Araneus ventricosus]|uniref:Uncharacterized protein n=1 Tax=Araneus ventricosus TaxID=182803 RepID=A0A4Y2PYG0_ARAVE|nr:hypothetical protein AVEN_258454-1 [Araneus ventricosus]GBN56291.1 hypothetical protein AVEN_17898-1 [Araneus ventricosus]GBN56322.1 hypothetical protein AVEN_57772-1 [Araneus ventricosus]
MNVLDLPGVRKPHFLELCQSVDAISQNVTRELGEIRYVAIIPNMAKYLYQILKEIFQQEIFLSVCPSACGYDKSETPRPRWKKFGGWLQH